MPPADLLGFAPAMEVMQWARKEILSNDGRLYNPDHQHLVDADIAVLWAGVTNITKGRQVLGQAEKIMFRAGGWQKARQEEQMADWFGDVPAFLITLDANYCRDCSDAEFCALLEHELYHLAHAKDACGDLRYSSETGLPAIALCGHDVEEFVGVVRRYGANADVQRMIDAAAMPPSVSRLDVAQACGTCLLRVA